METQFELDIKKKIDRVLEDFDFDKAFTIMTGIGWRYYNPKDLGTTVPVTKDRIQQCARDVLESSFKSAWNGDKANYPYHTGSGGFEATCWKWVEREQVVFTFDLALVPVQSRCRD